MPLIFWVAAGGALGAGARYLVTSGSARLFGHGFPVGTMVVNVTGSLVMGLLITWLALRGQASAETRAFLTTGILGGFTTFSAFSLDFATLFERKQFGAAFSYAALSVALSLLAIFAGMLLARKVLT